MTHTVNTSWKGDMQFNALVSGHSVTMDASPEFGGQDAGSRPKELLLAAIAGCTGMDVVELLRKMRVDVQEFDLEVKAEVSEGHPKVYTQMHIIYKLKGHNIDSAKVQKAVDMSQEKYCGVSAMLRKAMEITYEIKIL
ncbi:OsmC family protein [Paludibacter jiangxiensis]|uniref:Putative redox protein n=1 Tax=Paludibacter jiangxiensis TaxID=681398 RepID=A0A170ZI64_9BACT|nr:OsmC family protein [Paludibacter jiangxiensis]GAT62692.1 putative redox protein [Paludibacter jiangxiensis]